MATWLLFDANYLCHRAYHAMGDLSFNDGQTGMLYGFFSDMLGFQELFGTRHVAFAFDHLPSKRKAAYPKYKIKRDEHYKNASDSDKAGIDEFRRQVITLRDNYLPNLGFANVWHAVGYEADDFLAQGVRSLAGLADEAIIITADGDLDQCLDGLRIIRYNPHVRASTNEASFRQEYGIGPDKWASVKAYAGCGTDDVRGIPGCAETTAIKYITGTLPTHYKVYQRITSHQGQMVYQRNLKLVTLPLEGTPPVEFLPDTFTMDRWRAFADKHGFASIRDYAPRGHRRDAIRKPVGFGLT